VVRWIALLADHGGATLSDAAIIAQRELLTLRRLREAQQQSGKLHLLPAIDELIAAAEAQVRLELGAK
jgi:hypothetical protein